MAAPRKSKVDPSHEFLWSDDSPFDGYLIVGIVPPRYIPDGTEWASVAYGDSKVLISMPPFYVIKITEGYADQISSVIYTSDLDPPNTEYVCWFMDINKKYLSLTASDRFIVTSETFTPPYDLLQVPIVGQTYPEPD